MRRLPLPTPPRCLMSLIVGAILVATVVAIWANPATAGEQLPPATAVQAVDYASSRYPSTNSAQAATQTSQATPPLMPQTPLSDQAAAEVKRVIQALKQAALDPTPEVRAAAVMGLSPFAYYDETIIDVLWEAAKAEEPQVRQAAVLAFVSFPEANERAIDALLRFAGDEEIDAAARRGIEPRLMQLGAKAVVPRVIFALETGDTATKRRMIALLARFEAGSRGAIEALLTVAGEDAEEPGLRAAALTAVAKITTRVVVTDAARLALDEAAVNAVQQSIAASDSDGDGRIPVDSRISMLLDESTRGGALVISDEDVDGDGFVTPEELLPLFRFLVKHYHPNKKAFAEVILGSQYDEMSPRDYSMRQQQLMEATQRRAILSGAGIGAGGGNL